MRESSKEAYIARVERIRQTPKLANVLSTANSVLTAIGYAAYPLLLILLIAFKSEMLLRCIVVPAVAFAALSAFRYAFNAKRPYELYDFKPISNKSTKGKSFPSRHTFCMFMIALSWFPLNGWVAAILLACAIAMGIIRVLLGVHFSRDVVAGALAAFAFAYVGYAIIPW